MPTEGYTRSYLYKRVVSAKAFMDSHYAEKIDIDSIAEEASFSKFHFIRLFKEIYGKTPHQYLTAVRLDKAIILLRKGKPVTEVCATVGFESLSSFSGLFKRFAGVSPLAFLTEERNRQQQISANPLRYIPGCFAYQHGWVEDSNSGEVEVKAADDLCSGRNKQQLK